MKSAYGRWLSGEARAPAPRLWTWVAGQLGALGQDTAGGAREGAALETFCGRCFSAL